MRSGQTNTTTCQPPAERCSAAGALSAFASLLLIVALSIPGTTSAADPDDIRGPDVTIIEDENRTILEYRQGGVLRMVRVVPSWGKPYYLVPRDQTAGHEDLERAETLLPSWVIIEF